MPEGECKQSGNLMFKNMFFHFQQRGRWEWKHSLLWNIATITKPLDESLRRDCVTKSICKHREGAFESLRNVETPPTMTSRSEMKRDKWWAFIYFTAKTSGSRRFRGRSFENYNLCVCLNEIDLMEFALSFRPIYLRNEVDLTERPINIVKSDLPIILRSPFRRSHHSK